MSLSAELLPDEGGCDGWVFLDCVASEVDVSVVAVVTGPDVVVAVVDAVVDTVVAVDEASGEDCGPVRRAYCGSLGFSSLLLVACSGFDETAGLDAGGGLVIMRTTNFFSSNSYSASLFSSARILPL